MWMWGGRTHVGRPAPYGNAPSVKDGGGGVNNPRPVYLFSIGTVETTGVVGLTTRPPTTFVFFNIIWIAWGGGVGGPPPLLYIFLFYCYLKQIVCF